jgi:hypothetical protein
MNLGVTPRKVLKRVGKIMLARVKFIVGFIVIGCLIF